VIWAESRALSLARTALIPFLLLIMSGCSFSAEPIDLRTVERTAAPHDALACPPGVCTGRADFESPVFEVDATHLLARAADVILKEPRTERVASDDALGQLVFVQRSRVFRFPDTVRVQAVAVDGGTSVILYSRSNVGYWDMGVNRARLRDWLAKLSRAMPTP
jgi:uncharacterized protein (DUF1499 family)